MRRRLLRRSGESAPSVRALELPLSDLTLRVLMAADKFTG